MKMKFVRAMIFVVSLSVFAGHAVALDARGLWLDGEGRAKMRVDFCEGGTLCAKIVWLRQPTDRHGKPLVDSNNGDVRLRNRPIIGLPVAYNMRKTGSNEWTGRVYDPQRGGQTYTGYMTLLRDGRLKVQGCLGFICESEYWSPLPDKQRKQTR